MDTTDRPNLPLPARLPVSVPATVPTIAREFDAAPAPSSIDARQLLRGLLRNWWRIMLIWGVISAPLVYLVYKLVQPTYLAESKILVENNQPELFTAPAITNEPGGNLAPPYLQTEVTTILNGSVIGKALALQSNILERKVAASDPGRAAKTTIGSLPMLREWADPRAELADRLEVKVITRTHWISVALESTEPEQATEIVNAIVGAYKKQNEEHGQAVNKTLVASLEEYQKELDKKIQERKRQLRIAAASGNVIVPRPRLDPNKSEDGEQTIQPNFDVLALDQFKTTKERLLQTRLELMELEARLQVKEAEALQASAAGNAPEDLSGAGNERTLQAQIEQEFKRDPQAAALIEEIRAAKETLEHTKGLARQTHDPARMAAEKRLAGLMEEWYDLWDAKQEEIRRSLLVPTSAKAPELETPADIKRRIQEAKFKETRYAELIKQTEKQMKDANAGSVEATFLRDDLDMYNNMYDQVNRRLETLRFSQNKPKINVEFIEPADVPRVPSNNKRIRYMLIIPAGVLLPILLLFLLLEVKAERVANPDMLSSRVQSEVYALPPLPSARAPRKLNAAGVDDQIDRFIQRLDHLRFALCGDQTNVDLGRCILVTSAVGGEGKTTLAAQLAARFGNAGISTLLIDADLRRAALCPLLDVPEGPGLSDVLRGEADVENVLIPIQDGTFSLFAAGTPVSDTSRLFQGRAFAMLVASLRQRYEMIIIDSPPILPVPDALMMGRWADGALLSARFEVSRSPQVERARRQLDNAGIPVLGTVINGMRSADAYYGRYSYSRVRDPQAESPGSVSTPS